MNFDYKKALYRKDNKGVPQVWYAEVGKAGIVNVYYGAVNGSIQHEQVRTARKLEDEVRSRYVAKVKSGYKYLKEIADSASFPVEEQLNKFLVTYLPAHRTGTSGAHLAMLAVAYNNNNNKIYTKGQEYIGQPKINGLRCAIFAKFNTGDLFKPVSLEFVSREGTKWNSLADLEEYLLKNIPKGMLDRMVNEGMGLDGELYLPGHTVNDINSYVKNTDSPNNKKIQYWCYDLIDPDGTQDLRYFVLDCNECISSSIVSKHCHHSNIKRLVFLDRYIITNHSTAKMFRDRFIDWGFEGLMLRLESATYQYGRRNSSLIKYKAVLEGTFEIVDIISQGVKRPDYPLFELRNDLNNETFFVKISATTAVQKQMLVNKAKYIGRNMEVEFGERSGVKQVPFHCKTCNLA